MRRPVRSSLLLLALIWPASAGALLTDDESDNDAVATAGTQVAVSGTVTVDVGRLSLDAGDIDFVGIASLQPGDAIMASTTPLDDADFEAPDTVIGVFDDGGALVCQNDTAFNNDLDIPPVGEGSLCRHLVTAAGDYYVGVTGWSVMPFDGSHIQSGDYVLSVTITTAFDTDGDGTPDGSDPDDDNDGRLDGVDPDPFDPMVCGDVDADLCDDCWVQVDGFGPLVDADTSNDGSDQDHDGICNLGDDDDDNDGVEDRFDICPLDPEDRCFARMPGAPPPWLSLVLLASGMAAVRRR